MFRVERPLAHPDKILPSQTEIHIMVSSTLPAQLYDLFHNPAGTLSHNIILFSNLDYKSITAKIIHVLYRNLKLHSLETFFRIGCQDENKKPKNADLQTKLGFLVILMFVSGISS